METTTTWVTKIGKYNSSTWDTYIFDSYFMFTVPLFFSLHFSLYGLLFKNPESTAHPESLLFLDFFALCLKEECYN